ncbi:MAG TPA: hypothetical protein VFG73_04560 [Rhodanobacteraceae bacterium]|nr:hypothetical protein [Rhodanobacteraceae bacterium]
MLVLLLAPLAGFAQGPSPLPHPDLDISLGGEVYCEVVLPDGSVVVGGSFEAVNGTPRHNLAKIQPNGELDAAWSPTPDGNVYALAADAAGDVYAGGDFTHIGAVVRDYIAKLQGTGTGAVVADWNPSPNAGVYALAADPAGDLYAGGSFTSIGGVSRGYIAKLTGDGVVDTGWNPSADGGIGVMALNSSGDLFVGGAFNFIGGQVRVNLAKLDGTNGAADPEWSPQPDGYIYAMAVDANDDLYIGGIFTAVGGRMRSYLAKLQGTGSGAADSSWNPSPDDYVLDLLADANGDVYVGGYFSQIGGQMRAGIAKLSGGGVGAAYAGWVPSISGVIDALAINADGTALYVGGYLGEPGSLTHAWAALDASTGETGAGGTITVPGTVEAIAEQPDGGTIVGGRFSLANGVERHGLLRLEPDGTLDPAWNPSANDTVTALAVDASGDVYAGGAFFQVGGQARSYIAKLSGTGTGAVDVNWNPSANDWVYALALDSNGNVFAGGSFTAIGGLSRERIARLNGAGYGIADPDWDPGADGVVYSIAVDSSDNVYAGGGFSHIGGQARNFAAKLSNAGMGAVDPDWKPNADGSVQVLLPDDAGHVYAGGNFLYIGGKPRNHIARLSASGAGAADATWDPSADASVRALAMDAAGYLYAGGRFTHIGGQARNYLASLSVRGSGAAGPAWNPSADDIVNALGVSASGTIYAGGAFTKVGGQSRAGLAGFDGSDLIFASGFERP